ncbi:hypothetical protein E4U55_003224 [Claviceps digitariae]|nr:hypothetical protein E4U55_003224 [Claviceps digitariae]
MSYAILPHDDMTESSSSLDKSLDSIDHAIAEDRQFLKLRWRTAVILIVCCGLFSALILIIVMVSFMVSSTAHHARTCPGRTASTKGLACGNTTEQARAAGCEFDILSYSWVPSRCFDRDTANEFLAWLEDNERQYGAWPFFADSNGRQRIANLSSLAERLFVESYSTQEEHLGHCIFWMRHLDRVIQGLVPQTSRGADMHHTIHCTNALLEQFDSKAEPKVGPHAVLTVAFNTC